MGDDAPESLPAVYIQLAQSDNDYDYDDSHAVLDPAEQCLADLAQDSRLAPFRETSVKELARHAFRRALKKCTTYADEVTRLQAILAYHPGQVWRWLLAWILVVIGWGLLVYWCGGFTPLSVSVSAVCVIGVVAHFIITQMLDERFKRQRQEVVEWVVAWDAGVAALSAADRFWHNPRDYAREAVCQFARDTPAAVGVPRDTEEHARAWSGMCAWQPGDWWTLNRLGEVYSHKDPARVLPTALAIIAVECADAPLKKRVRTIGMALVELARRLDRDPDYAGNSNVLFGPEGDKYVVRALSINARAPDVPGH